MSTYVIAKYFWSVCHELHREMAHLHVAKKEPASKFSFFFLPVPAEICH